MKNKAVLELENKALIREKNIIKWDEEDFKFYFELLVPFIDDLVEDIPLYSSKEFKDYAKKAKRRSLSLLK